VRKLFAAAPADAERRICRNEQGFIAYNDMKNDVSA